MDNKEIKPVIPKAEEPIVIGHIKKEKERGPLGVIIFFLLLVLFTLFLPNITDYFKNMLNKEKEVNPIIKNEEDNLKQEEEDEDIQEIIYYEINETLNITIDDLLFDNFVKENNQLSFNVTNKKIKNYTFKLDNYYIELYDNSDMLLERLKVNNTTIILPNEIENIILGYKNNNIQKLNIIVIKDENYPSITLEEDENKISKLVCNDNISSLEYIFSDGKLSQIKETVALDNKTNDYISLLENYRRINNEVIGTDGVDVAYIEAENNFNFNLLVDYAKVNKIDLDELKYYEKNTSSKIIKFELEASNYNCS